MSDGFQRLRELIGDHAAFRMMNCWGGTRLYIPIPEHCHEKHNIALAIGLDAMKIMAAEFGGDRLEIPTGYDALKQIRNADILERINNGEHQSILALDYGLTSRQIRNIITKQPPVVDSNQLDLFA